MIHAWIRNKIINSGSFDGVEVHPIVLPQSKNHPSVIYTKIDSIDEKIKSDVGPLAKERWSFGCHASTLEKVIEMVADIKYLFDNSYDATSNIQRVRYDQTSTELYDEETEIFSVHIDFEIRKIN